MALHAIKPRQLQVFVTLADTQHVTTSAELLSLSQPAVSMALNELEKQLGPLFERHKGRLYLNQRGLECLPKAREILQRMDDLYHLSQSPHLEGELRIGASNSVGNYRVGQLLSSFMQQHPRVKVTMEVGNTRAIAAKIRQHQLDVACVEGPVHDAHITAIAWRDDELLVCAAPTHALANKAALNAADFAGAAWILREQGSATRDLIEQALMQLPVGKVVLELGQIEAIKQAVIAGLGIACLPESAIDDALAAQRLTVLPTPFLNLHRRLSLILPRDNYQGRLVTAFVDSLFSQ